MTDLIKREDALKAIIASSDLYRSSVTTQRMIRALPAVDPVVNAPEYLCTFPQCGCVAKGQWCPAPRSPATIREAALTDKLAKAVEALREIQADGPSHGAIKYTLRTVLAELEGKS